MPDDETKRETVPSLAPPSMGQIAFSTFWGHRIAHPDLVVSTWENLSPAARTAWECAAEGHEPSSGTASFEAYWRCCGVPAPAGWEDLEPDARAAWDAVAKITEG